MTLAMDTLPAAKLSFEEKTWNLFRLGYSARLWFAEVFQVTNPEGTVYRVDAREGTCNCPWGMQGKDCCHVRGLKTLVDDQAKNAEGEERAVCEDWYRLVDDCVAARLERAA